MNWIKTSEQLPQAWDDVLAYFRGRCYVVYLDEGLFWCMAEDCEPATTPTHWMPLPEQPK